MVNDRERGEEAFGAWDVFCELADRVGTALVEIEEREFGWHDNQFARLKSKYDRKYAQARERWRTQARGLLKYQWIYEHHDWSSALDAQLAVNASIGAAIAAHWRAKQACIVNAYLRSHTVLCEGSGGPESRTRRNVDDDEQNRLELALEDLERRNEMEQFEIEERQEAAEDRWYHRGLVADRIAQEEGDDAAEEYLDEYRIDEGEYEYSYGSKLDRIWSALRAAREHETYLVEQLRKLSSARPNDPNDLEEDLSLLVPLPRNTPGDTPGATPF